MAQITLRIPRGSNYTATPVNCQESMIVSCICIVVVYRFPETLGDSSEARIQPLIARQTRHRDSARDSDEFSTGDRGDANVEECLEKSSRQSFFFLFLTK